MTGERLSFKGNERMNDRRVRPGTRSMAVMAALAAVGIIFGALTSAVNQGFGPEHEYVSKALGSGWCWLLAGYAACMTGTNFRMQIVNLAAGTLATTATLIVGLWSPWYVLWHGLWHGGSRQTDHAGRTPSGPWHRLDPRHHHRTAPPGPHGPRESRHRRGSRRGRDPAVQCSSSSMRLWHRSMVEGSTPPGSPHAPRCRPRPGSGRRRGCGQDPHAVVASQLPFQVRDRSAGSVCCWLRKAATAACGLCTSRR